MGMNSMVGVCQQQKNNANPTITTNMNNVTITSSYAGNRVGENPPIDPSQALVTEVRAGGEVPANGVAYQLGAGSTAVIQNSIVINYDTSGISDSDLPADGSCELKITITNFQGPTTNPISGWNFADGTYYPQKASQATFIIGTLNRSDVNAGDTTDTPSIGTANLEIDSPDPTDQAPSNLNRLTFQTQPPNRVGNVGFGVQVKLADGTFTEITPSSNQITFVAGSIKPQLIELPTYNITAVTITAKRSTPNESLVPFVPLEAPPPPPLILDSTNSFTAGEATLFYEDTRQTPPPPYSIANAFQVTYDSSPLDPTLYPDGDEVVYRYTITGGGFDPSEIGWLDDANEYSQVFELSAPKAEVITGGIVTLNSVYPDFTDVAFKVQPLLNAESVSLVLSIQRTDGTFVPSEPITIAFADGAIEAY